LSYELTDNEASEHIAGFVTLMDNILTFDAGYFMARIWTNYYFSKSENQDPVCAFL